MAKRELFTIGSVELMGMEVTAPVDLTMTAYELGKGAIAVGENDNAIFVEAAVDDPEIPVIVAGIYDQKTEKIKLSAINSTLRRESDVKILTTLKSEQERIAGVIDKVKNKVLLALMIYAVINSEKTGSSETAAQLAELQSKIMDRDEDFVYTAKDLMATLITATDVKKGVKFPISEIYPSVNMTMVDTGDLGPSKILCGEFEIFRAVKASKVKVKYESIKDKFILNPERMKLYPPDPIPAHIEPSDRALETVELIKASWSRLPHLRKNNVLYEGPNGTGKTVDARTDATLLGLNYGKMTCFADMQMIDLLGGFLPNITKKPNLDICDDDIEYDPVGTYKMLTGIDKPDATPADARAALEDYRKSDVNNGNDFTFYESDIVKIFRNGGLCEVQEPTCVRDPAVLMAMNSMLEPGGTLNLPHETIKRHPECIFVFTTNRSYEGCRPMNQSLRDRFKIAMKCELPEESETVSRLKKSTGCKDTNFLKVLVQSMLALNKEMEDRGIIAHTSLRGMEDFVADVMDGFDIRKSLNQDIIYKITTDDDDLAQIFTFLENCTKIYNTKYAGK